MGCFVAKQVLIVDDDNAVRTLICMALSEEGYEVSSACTGLEALRRVDTLQPDLVISDVVMPDLSGVEMLEGLRNRRETKDVPVILVTASEDKTIFAKGVSLNARHYLNKPFELDQLLLKVRNAIGDP